MVIASWQKQHFVPLTVNAKNIWKKLMMNIANSIDNALNSLYNTTILNKKGFTMKKLLTALAFGLIATFAQAEASFDQIEGLIQQKNYAAAASGLETIIQNHPKSAKAFYAMAQAQAGLGNQDKAQKALNIATGLNPTLDFAPASSVASLKEAITPQTKKIEAIEESHGLRNFVLFVMFVGFAVAMYFVWSVYSRKKEEELRESDAKFLREEAARQERDAQRKREHMEMLAKQDAERKAELAAEAALKAHKNYGHERFDPANPDKLKTVKQFKEEQAAAKAAELQATELREARARADAAEASARMYRTSAQAVQPTQVVHTNSGSNDMLTGVLIGNMLSGHHHETTRVVEREVVREAPSRSSTWDDTPAPTVRESRSSSWDDTPSTPSRSSSWDDDSSSSSSSSSSSWSSSSSSSSDSSWSSSSSSDSSSSSSWD
jgi:predicted negative regulator of RcsB-dependent stress response